MAISNTGEIFITKSVTSITPVSWVKILSAGEYGFGGLNPGMMDWNTAAGIGRFISGSANGPSANAFFGINIPHTGTTYNAQVAFRNNSGLYFRTQEAGVWNPWYVCRDSNNTTVDTNGFIKRASPIVKLFSDGNSELNAESDGVTTERTDTGVYQVSGVMGFNADTAWHIEVPKDENGQALIWVDYEVSADGDITVKTYHRTHPASPAFAQNTLQGYQNGDPIDIPAGRWLDLRVQVYAADVSESEESDMESSSASDISAD
jgi:hypothetical protein